MERFKKVLALALALVMAISVLPIQAFAANIPSGATGQTVVTCFYARTGYNYPIRQSGASSVLANVIRDVDNKGLAMMFVEADGASISGIGVGGELTSGVIKKTNAGKNIWAYCIEHGVSGGNGLNRTAQSTDINVFWRNLSQTAKWGIEACLLCGFPSVTNLGGVTSWGDLYAATQAVIWEFQTGNRTIKTSNGLRVGTTLSSSKEVANFGSTTKTAYNALVSSINAFFTQPSFYGNTITLEWNNSNSRYEKSITDTNGVIGNYTLKTGNGVSASISGNTLTLYTTNASLRNVNMTFEHKVANSSAKSDQVLMVLNHSTEQIAICGTAGDPIPFPLKATVNEVSDYSVKKTDATGTALTGVTFGVWTNSSCSGNPSYTIVTGSNGVAVLSKALLGTYYAKEIAAPSGYAINSSIVTMTKGTSPSTSSVIKDTDMGKITITKATDDGKNLSGWEFTVKGNGKTYTAKTDNNGVAVFENLPRYAITGANGTATVISYSITESNAPKDVIWYYDATGVQTKSLLPLVSGKQQSVDVVFTNKTKLGNLEVRKTSEDAMVEGLVFKLTGTSFSGIEVNEIAITDKNGVARFNDIPIGDSYKLEEISTPIKYVQPNAITDISIEWKETKSETVESISNILKKWTVNITKIDADRTVAQGDGTLAGAVYGVYKNGVLLDKYTTDKNGKFTTKEYICGDDYTLKEISPSEGYLLNDEVIKLDVDAANYTVEHNTENVTVKETSIYGKIDIMKSFSDGYGSTLKKVPEPDAQFEIYLKSAGSYVNAKATERDLITTDMNGHAITKYLPYGTYVIHQVKGADETIFHEDREIKLEKNTEIYKFEWTNEDNCYYLTVVKKDVETGKTIPVANAGFQIYYPSGEQVVQTITYPKKQTISTFYTDETGTLTLPYQLKYGSGYKLVEVQAPEGYVLDSTPVLFDILKGKSTTDGGLATVEITKSNVAQKGIIKVYKEGEVLSTVTVNDDIYTPVYEVKGLAGAVYEVKAIEDIITPDGTVRAKAGTVVDTIITGPDGWAYSEKLYLGRYFVTEITAPYGMVLNGNAATVTLEYEGQEKSVVYEQTSFLNNRQKVSIDILKNMEVDDDYGIGTNGEVMNVMFGLYSKNDIVALDGTKIPAGGLVERVVMDNNGHASVSVDLPLGEYYFKEIETDEHYMASEDEYIVNFQYGDQTTETVTITANDYQPIDNYIIYGAVVVNKTNTEGEPLEGVLFGIFSPSETTFTKENAIATAITNSEGVARFEKVPFGNWKIVELETITGYVLNDSINDVDIYEPDDVFTLDIVNEHIKGSVAVTKFDADYPENTLNGAEFEVYEAVEVTEDNAADFDFTCEYEGITYGVGSSIGKLEEYDGGKYQLDELLFGKYFIREIKAPEGFLLDSNYYLFDIVNNKEVVDVSNKIEFEGFYDNPIKGGVRIIKVDEDTYELLSGAVFDVYRDINGNGKYEKDIDTFVGNLNETSKGIYELLDLRYGGYFVYEASAPEYYVSDPNYYYFFISEDGEIVTVSNVDLDEDTLSKILDGTPLSKDDLKVINVFSNDRIPETPNTGDETIILPFAIATAASIAGLTFTYKKGKKKDDGVNS